MLTGKTTITALAVALVATMLLPLEGEAKRKNRMKNAGSSPFAMQCADNGMRLKSARRMGDQRFGKQDKLMYRSLGRNNSAFLPVNHGRGNQRGFANNWGGRRGFDPRCNNRGSNMRWNRAAFNRFDRHDRGRHLGWYKNKHGRGFDCDDRGRAFSRNFARNWF